MAIFEIALSTFLGTLATNIVNIALPTISGYFQVGTGLVSWVSMVYLLVLCSTIMAFGRLADIRGFKNIFLAGFAIFAAASLLCAISLDIYMLIVSRGVQAIGASMFIAVSPAMISAILLPEVRSKGMDYLSVAAAVGIALGPGIGGYLTAFVGWRSIFFVNISRDFVWPSNAYLHSDGAVDGVLSLLEFRGWDKSNCGIIVEKIANYTSYS